MNALVTYVGGMDAVYAYFPSGDSRRVAKGETITILAVDAATLDPTEWTTTQPTKEKQ